MKAKAKKKDAKPTVKEKSVFTCTHCQKKFDNYSNWHSHIKLHSTEEPYECDICGYTCKVQKYLTRHIKTTHTKPKGNRCKVCGKCFHFNCDLRDHLRVHTGEKPNKCDVCDKAFSSTYSLGVHKLIHTGEKPYHCLYCDYACRDNSTIRRHMERHMGITKDYPCGICNKNFKSKKTLQFHVDEIHLQLDIRKYSCGQCNKGFKTKATLNTHRATIHGKPNRIKCDICGVTTTKNNLKSHMRRHTDERPHLCSYTPCGQKFKDKGDLKRHLLIHYPEKQHKCTICNRRFPRKVRLNKHIALHVNGYSVQCDQCGEMFSSKDLLSVHIKRAHSPNSRKYICDICGILICSRAGIVRHLQYGHGTEKDTTCQICHKDYNEYLLLKEHYIRHHNTKYCLIENKKEDDTTVKQEPSEESEEVTDTPQFIYELNVQKQENEDVTPKTSDPTQPQSDEPYIIDSDSITYSKSVLSEDIERSIRERNRTEDRFDDFFIGHVLKKTQKNDTPKQPTENKKKKIVDPKRVEEMLNKVRQSKEYKVLEKLRREYNRRIKMATSFVNQKEPKPIRYFKNPLKMNDTEMNSEENNQKDDINGDELTKGDENGDECNSDEEANNGKLRFNTHQCYICFKLFKTKSDLKRHCRNHFDICNEKMLKKCPFCGYVTNKQISKHIRVKHQVNIDIPYGKIKERDTQNGSKYVFEIDKDCDLEIIPSISNLNKIASMKIDEKKRQSNNLFLGTTKLVRKGDHWMVEKKAVSVNKEYILPEFTKSDYETLRSVGDNYLERIRNLSIIAKKKGFKMLYPCSGCEKICLTMSALKLHNRKHETNPKKFKPKVWKNKILNGLDGKYRYVNKNNKNKMVVKKSGKSKKSGNLENKGKKNSEKTENRFADPLPVRNKHKCDKKLIEFYKKNIKGGDIEFWHFLKIFNKMSRENVNDFKDLESRNDFGYHKFIDNEGTSTTNTAKSTKDSIDNKKKIPKKKCQTKKKGFTRAIMLSRKEYLKRMEIKNQMRKRLEMAEN